MAPSPVATELDAQYRVLREGAGVLVDEETVWIRALGPDAAEYLQGQVTNDVEALGPGSGCYAALLDRKGKMQADMRVLRTGPDEFLIGTEAITAERVTKHLEMYKVASRVEIEPLADRAVVSLIGPAAESVLGIPSPAEHATAPHDLGGIEGLVIGTAAGIDFLCAAEDAVRAAARLCEGEAEPVEREAVEIVRVESGTPRFGHEMDEATIPEEAGINVRAVSFTKGCYIGQETVARLHYRGKPNRHLRRLVLDAPARAGDTVRGADREIGKVGTAVVSPARGPLALAIIRREAVPGDSVTVGEAGTRATVEEIA